MTNGNDTARRSEVTDQRERVDSQGGQSVDSPGDELSARIAAAIAELDWTQLLAANPLVQAQVAWLQHPQAFGERMGRLYSDLWRLQWHGWQRLLGHPDPDPISPNPYDERFADPLWTEQPAWDEVKEWYLTLYRHIREMTTEIPGMSDKERRRVAFWFKQWLDAVAPTNCLWTNPVAQRKALESGGQTLSEGFQRFLGDVQLGTVRMTDPEDFRVGENLATTAGSVVLRNRLVEVIHYTPTQAQVHAEPVVIITPWINKFYVLDLTPQKSLVRFLLDQGLDVFITSWRNPGLPLRNVRIDDYLMEGVHATIEVARQMSGARQVHTVGYCIGGTALALYLAWANRRFAAAEMPVADWTLFTTLVDFEHPGEIDVFIDEAGVARLCQQMQRKGYLDGQEMAIAFRLLRANGLIWHYVVHGWLYGEKPRPFDVLFWNMDTTRMPQAMHTWYLTELYLHNRLIQPDALTVAGEALDLTAITQPLYAVAAEDDHIAPWEQTFRVANHVSGDKRFVLSSSGHILGIINPPVEPPKRSYWAGPAQCEDQAEAWRQRTAECAGSWWLDWMDWLKPRTGPLVAARPASAVEFPELAPAPGTYVLES